MGRAGESLLEALHSPTAQPADGALGAIEPLGDLLD